MKYGILKRGAGILLSAVLILGSLAGCGKTDNGAVGNEGNSQTGEKVEEGGEQALGRFLEEDVTLPIVFSSIYDMRKLEDGTIRIIGKNADDGKETVWDSKDSGVNWEKAFDAPGELQDEENGYIDYAALSLDGQSVWVYNRIAEGGIKPILYLVSSEGSIGQIPFELPAAEQSGQGSAQSFSTNVSADEKEGEEGAGDNVMNRSDVKNLILDICFLGADQIMVTDMTDKIFQISISDGSVKQTYDFNGMEDTHQVFTAGKKMLVVTSTEVLVYDTETGEQQQAEEALQQSVAESGFFHAVDSMDAGESIYYLTGKGLFHYKFGGSVMEQLIDGSMNTLGSPAFYPGALTMIDEQNLLIAANDANSEVGDGMVLLRYTWSKDTPAKPDKELKVYSLYNNRELRQAVSSFQKDHPDVYVNYQVALSEENGTTVSDALKTLTTEIMAGKGPDLILLDGMPVNTYIEKGILKDMSPILADKSNYFENILTAYQDAQGQLCAIPARFMIPAAQGGSANYTPGEDFDTFTAKQGILANTDPEAIVERFWYSCGAAWQKEDKTLDAGKITEFLSKLKNAYGEYDSSAVDEEVYQSISQGGAVNELHKVSLSWGDFDLAFGRIKVSTGLFGRMDYGMMNSVNEKLGGGDYGLMPGQAKQVFVPAMILGISSKASQPETAEEFAGYLLSSEAQKVSQFGGFPVEKEAFKSVIDGHEYADKESLVGVAGGGSDIDEILDYALIPTPEEEIQKLTNLAESLTTPALQDDVIKAAVVEQGTKVLKGELSPEEGTDAIMQKVNIYLAE